MFCSTEQSCCTQADTGLTFARPQDILAAAVPAASPSLAWDAAASEAKEDPVQTQTQHKKVKPSVSFSYICLLLPVMQINFVCYACGGMSSASHAACLSYRFWTKACLKVVCLALLAGKYS